MSARVIIRADGNSEMGLGHVVRSLALVQMLQPAFTCRFLIRAPAEALRELIACHCPDWEALPAEEDRLAEAQRIAASLVPGDIVVLDGYHFREDYQRIIRSSGCKLVCIDDIHAYPFVADAIINHAGGITPDDYDAAASTRFYLGLDYVLLRPPFLMAAHRPPPQPAEDSLLICLGGADPTNDTLSVLQAAVARGAAAAYRVVIGSAYRHREALTTWIVGSGASVSLHENLDAAAMVDLMQQCRQAVTPPSTVAYEYLCAGHTLYLHQIADNQRRMLAFLTSQGLAFHWSDYPADEQQTRLAAQRRRVLLDGHADRRLRDAFHRLRFEARPATPEDMRLFFDWTNDPLVRTQSYHSGAVAWEDHQRWFANKMRQPDVLLVVVTYDGQPAGQVRFEPGDAGQTVLSYSLAASYRGQGLSHLLLETAIAYFRQQHPEPTVLVGYVKADNPASRRAFIKLNFREQPTDRYPDSYQYTFSYA